MTLSDLFGMAARRLWRRPGLALVSIVTLGAGIGLTASLFAVLNAVLWRPLAVDDFWQLSDERRMTTRSFTLARLRRHREAFLNPRLPERCLAGDGPRRLLAVEVEA